MVLVLPAPLGPRKATTVPGSTSRSMRRTARTPPKILLAPRSATAGTGSERAAAACADPRVVRSGLGPAVVVMGTSLPPRAAARKDHRSRSPGDRCQGFVEGRPRLTMKSTGPTIRVGVTVVPGCCEGHTRSASSTKP